MSEKEIEIAEKVANALPNMSEFHKGYLMGLCEGNEGEKKEEKKEN